MDHCLRVLVRLALARLPRRNDHESSTVISESARKKPCFVKRLSHGSSPRCASREHDSFAISSRRSTRDTPDRCRVDAEWTLHMQRCKCNSCTQHAIDAANALRVDSCCAPTFTPGLGRGRLGADLRSPPRANPRWSLGAARHAVDVSRGPLKRTTPCQNVLSTSNPRVIASSV